MREVILISPGVFIRARKFGRDPWHEARDISGRGPWHQVRDIGGRYPELTALTRCGRIFFYDEVTETSAVLPETERICGSCLRRR